MNMKVNMIHKIKVQKRENLEHNHEQNNECIKEQCREKSKIKRQVNEAYLARVAGP